MPFGTCEPCPDDAVRSFFLSSESSEHTPLTSHTSQLHEPFCQPFGNRRLMHCTPTSSTPAPSSPGPSGSGEIPAWESCGRIVEKERGDFYEFLACNVFIALLAVGVVLVRSKQLKTMQARQLAARIGLTRRLPGGWVG